MNRFRRGKESLNYIRNGTYLFRVYIIEIGVTAHKFAWIVGRASTFHDLPKLGRLRTLILALLAPMNFDRPST